MYFTDSQLAIIHPVFVLLQDGLDIEVKCAPLPFATHPQGELDDVEIFGQLTKRMLRSYTISNK